QGRTFENPVERRRQVAEFDERVALPQLARDWKVPFLSKVGRRKIHRSMCKKTSGNMPSSPSYTQFLHLWKEVCRTHPKLRQFPFPPKEPAAGAKVVLAEVFGGKRPEDERQARFGDLLQRLMSLEPRPPALLAFLTPVP
ncbi:unnamed protein product, partial [Hapterophycus canaliculatus]